jgi:hypothetical protein
MFNKHKLELRVTKDEKPAKASEMPHILWMKIDDQQVGKIVRTTVITVGSVVAANKVLKTACEIAVIIAKK